MTRGYGLECWNRRQIVDASKPDSGLKKFFDLLPEENLNNDELSKGEDDEQ
jgi:hypothetical protein